MSLSKSSSDKVQSYIEDLQLIEDAMEIVGTKHKGYFLKTLQQLQQRIAELESRQEALLQAAHTNSYSNLLSKVTTAFSTEPAPPTEAELAYEREQAQYEQFAYEQARTVRVIDSVVFAISNWSKDGDTAPDVAQAIQSVVYPSALARLMSGDDYTLNLEPETMLKVTREGHALIQSLRDKADVAITNSQSTWDEHAPLIQDWVKSSMLPALYGATDERWQNDTPYTFEQINAWTRQTASRALDFPLVFDAFELSFSPDQADREAMAEFNNASVACRIDTSAPLNV